MRAYSYACVRRRMCITNRHGCVYAASTEDTRSHSRLTDQRAYHTQAIVIFTSYGLVHGGLVQLLAGAWETYRGNLFGGVVFCSYSGFFMGFGILEILLHNAASGFGADGMSRGLFLPFSSTVLLCALCYEHALAALGFGSCAQTRARHHVIAPVYSPPPLFLRHGRAHLHPLV